MKTPDPTNVWDAVITFLYFCFCLAVLAGAAYLVTLHAWSWWTMFWSYIFVSEIDVTRGCCEKEKEEEEEEEKQE